MNILSLLPQNEQHRIKGLKLKLDLLRELCICYEFCALAIQEFFFKKAFHKFDPVVGETLCQIRAYKYVNIYKKHMNLNSHVQVVFMNLCEKLEFAQKLIADYSQITPNIRNEKTKIWEAEQTIYNFINTWSLNYSLDEDFVYLGASLFLSNFNKMNYTNYLLEVDLENVCALLKLKKNKALKIVKHFQSILAKSSTEFVLVLAKEMSYDYEEIKKFVYYDTCQRAMLPCFLVTEIIIQHLLIKKEKILVGLSAKNKSNIHYVYQLEASRELGTFIIIDENANKDTLTGPCFTIYLQKKTACFDEQLLFEKTTKNLLSIIRECALDHPQYTGNISWDEEAYKVFLNKFFPHLIPRCFNWKKQFFVNHFFCDSLLHLYESSRDTIIPNIERINYECSESI